jgi:hypothetical protein
LKKWTIKKKWGLTVKQVDEVIQKRGVIQASGQECQMAYFQTKIPIWVDFGGSCNGRCWYILHIAIWSYVRPFCTFCAHLVYIFMVIWYIFSRFGT